MIPRRSRSRSRAHDPTTTTTTTTARGAHPLGRSRSRVGSALRRPGALRLHQLLGRAAHDEAGGGAGADGGLGRAALAAEVERGAAGRADGAYEAGGLGKEGIGC
jgi:hypothetical protein